MYIFNIGDKVQIPITKSYGVPLQRCNLVVECKMRYQDHAFIVGFVHGAIGIPNRYEVGPTKGQRGNVSEFLESDLKLYVNTLNNSSLQEMMRDSTKDLPPETARVMQELHKNALLHKSKLNGGNVTIKKDAGLRFNDGKLQWSLVHFRSLRPLVEVLMFGAKKYAPDNWKKGLDKKEILESMMRHLSSLMDGETHDPESGLHHIGHIFCNAMFYSYFNDNRTSNQDVREGWI